jgi:hypothetical protein
MTIFPRFPKRGARDQIVTLLTIPDCPLARHLLYMPGMNAAVQIVTATEGSAGAGVGKPPAVPGCEIATDASAAASGSNGETNGNWKELLKAAGLIPPRTAEPAAGSGNATPRMIAGPDPANGEVPLEAESASDGMPEAGATKAIRSGAGLAGRLAARAFPAAAGNSGRIRKEHAGSTQMEKRADRAAAAKQTGEHKVETAAFGTFPAPIAAGMEPPADIPAPVAAIPVVALHWSDSAPFEMHSLAVRDAGDAQQSTLRSDRTMGAGESQGEIIVSVPAMSGHDLAGEIRPEGSGIVKESAASAGMMRPGAPAANPDAANLDAANLGAANLDAPATVEPLHTFPVARHSGNALAAEVAEARDTITGRNSQPIRPAGSAADSEDTSRSLRSSVRAADPLSKAASRTGHARDARVFDAVREHSARISLNHLMDSAGPERRSEIFDAAQLNAPALRETGGLTAAGERQIGAPHQAVSPAGDPFAALDETRAMPPAWIHAGTHRAEAGYLDPALGWIGVRADTSANGVHASLVPASAEAAQVLGSHVAGLNAYLSEHHREPATVTMAAPQDGREGMGTGSGSGDRAPARHEQPQSGERRDEGAAVAGILARGPVGTVGAIAVRAPESGGRYISVMA